MSRALAGPLLLALLLRLVPILVADRAVGDVARYQRVADHLLDVSWNPYETRRLFPYPPPWATVEAGAEWLARRGAGSFPVNVKLPVLGADLLIVATLVSAARRGGASPAAAWIYAVHPVSVLVTGFHGQFDSIVLLFVVLALDALGRGRSDAAALLLSAAIATKSFPVLLLPFFLADRASPRRAARFAALALGPVAVLLLPFALADAGALRRELFGYSGIADFGWTGLVRGVEWLATGTLARSEARFWPIASTLSKILVFSAWAVLVVAVALRRLRWSVARACLGTVLVFHVFYGALSAQYLLWAVPLGVARPTRLFAFHAAGASAGLVGFYLFLAPGVLLPTPLDGVAAARAGHLWVAGTGATWVVSATWLLGLVREGVRAARTGRS